jgi:hypothetical protein
MGERAKPWLTPTEQLNGCDTEWFQVYKVEWSER